MKILNSISVSHLFQKNSIRKVLLIYRIFYWLLCSRSDKLLIFILSVFYLYCMQLLIYFKLVWNSISCQILNTHPSALHLCSVFINQTYNLTEEWIITILIFSPAGIKWVSLLTRIKTIPVLKSLINWNLFELSYGNGRMKMYLLCHLYLHGINLTFIQSSLMSNVNNV